MSDFHSYLRSKLGDGVRVISCNSVLVTRKVKTPRGTARRERRASMHRCDEILAMISDKVKS